MNIPKKFVILRGIEEGNIFYTTYNRYADYTKGPEGETCYQILGFAGPKNIQKALQAYKRKYSGF